MNDCQSEAGQGHEIFNLTEKELLYKQKIGMELLEVANIISPGISRLRGVILYELQATLACYARRKFSAGEISSDHMKNVMKVRFRLRFSDYHVQINGWGFNMDISLEKINTSLG